MQLSEQVRYLPIVLGLLVLGIEWYGHKTHKPWSFELGIPFGGKSELLGAVVPTPVPDDWLESHDVQTISGSRLAFKPDVGDQMVTCFGVLTLVPQGKQTAARYVRRASFGPPAFAIAVFASARLDGMDFEMALVVGGFMAAWWLLSIRRHKRNLDETYELMSAEILRKALAV